MSTGCDLDARRDGAERLVAVVRADAALRDRVRRRLPIAERLRLAAEILAVYALVQRRLRRTPLVDLVASLRGEVTDDGTPAWRRPEEHVHAIRLARGVARMLPRLPGETRCLSQSLVLTVLLARRGIGSKLVIGVVSEPEFQAHAWVEHGAVPVLPSQQPTFSPVTEL